MKCAVAIVLALVGAVLSNPVPPLGLGYGIPATSYSHSYIDHGLTYPRVVVTAPVVKPVYTTPILTAPIIKTPIITAPIMKTPIYTTSIIKTPIISSPYYYGWGKSYGGYGLGGHDLGGYGLGKIY